MSVTTNVTTDIICAVFTAMILIYLRTSTDHKSRMNHLFSWVCVFNIGMLLGDIPNWLFEGYAEPWYPAALHIGTFILFLSGCLIPWVYSLYIYTYMSTKAEMKKWVIPVINSIFAVNAGFLFLSVFNGLYYYIDEGNLYQRGDAFWLSQLLPLAMLVFDMVIILCHGKVLHLREKIAFISYIMLPVIGVVIQTATYGVSATYVACTISIFIIFLCIQSEQRLLSEQQTRDLDKAQFLITLSQIQPHFLYNSLQGIKQLCDSDPQRASEALGHFSFYLRGNLDSLVSTQLVTFKKELVYIKDYLYLEKMRFGERLNIEWELQYEDFLIPPLTIQPLVENAIRHGILCKKGGGTLTVKTQLEEKHVTVTIHDDGVGFDVTKPVEDGRSHIGIENTSKRLKTLCGGSLHITSEPGTGTTVVIKLPKSIVAKSIEHTSPLP